MVAKRVLSPLARIVFKHPGKQLPPQRGPAVIRRKTVHNRVTARNDQLRLIQQVLHVFKALCKPVNRGTLRLNVCVCQVGRPYCAGTPLARHCRSRDGLGQSCLSAGNEAENRTGGRRLEQSAASKIFLNGRLQKREMVRTPRMIMRKIRLHRGRVKIS